MWSLLHPTAKQKYYFISLVIQVFLSAFFVYHWDGFVFSESVKDFLHGITPYNLADSPAPLYTYHSHEIPWWYAYPPLPLLMMTASYGPAFLIFGGNEMVERIFIALPSVIGNLLCAYLIYALVARTASREAASRAEKLILFNPFLILIAAVRGMFDIWMVDFLLICLLSLRGQKYSLSAVFFGMGLLIKPIVAVFLPILVVYVWNKSGRGFFTIRFLGLIVMTFLIVCLPFLLFNPDGFLYQVVGMHWARPPAGYTLPSLLAMGQDSVLCNAISSSIATLWALILAASISLITFYLRLKRITSESGLVASLLLAILLFTFFNKVANPQYFVIPIVLTVMLLNGYRSHEWFTPFELRRYYKWMVIPFVGATLLNDGLYYGLLPHDIAMKLLDKTGDQLELQILNSLPFSSGIYYLLFSIAGGLLVAPAITLSFFMCYKAIKPMIPEVRDYIHGSLTSKIPEISRRTLALGFNIFVVILMVTVSFSTGWINYRHAVANEAPPPKPLGDKPVGIFYYYWWHNSTHDPGIQSDNWLASQLTPAEGYYDIGPAYMKEDIELMKQADIDFAVVSYGNIYPKRYDMFTRVCEEESFYFVPMIEVYDFAIDEPSEDDDALTLDEEVKREIISRINDVLSKIDSPCYLTYRGKPVLFMHTTPYFPYSGNNQEQSLFWSEIRSEVETQYGEIYWITNGNYSIYSAPEYNLESYFILPSQVWLNTLDGETAIENWRNRLEDIMQMSYHLKIATVFPYYDVFEFDDESRQNDSLIVTGKASIYDTFWQIAIDTNPDIVMIYSWNQYFDSACIEPTTEFGDMFVKQTSSWIGKFKN